MSLLNKLVKLTQAAVAQVKPWDNGATFKTVMQPPAQPYQAPQVGQDSLPTQNWDRTFSSTQGSGEVYTTQQNGPWYYQPQNGQATRYNLAVPYNIESMPKPKQYLKPIDRGY